LPLGLGSAYCIDLEASWIDTEEVLGMAATLQTIADELGISRSTVSNAYSRPDQLSPELREKILETARRFGYVGPHPTARSLRRGRAGAIGVLFTGSLSHAFTDPYAVQFLRGLSAAAERRSTGLLLVPVSMSDPDGAERALNAAAVDGFCVYCAPDWHGSLDIIRRRGLPLVTTQNPAEAGPDALVVSIDERAATRAVGEHVVGFGHRRLAVITDVAVPGSPAEPSCMAEPEQIPFFVSRERACGVRDALVAAGGSWSDVLFINAGENSRAAGAAAAAIALDRADRVTAVLALSDVLAFGVLDALAARRLRPGQDVSVTGFDDIPEAAEAGLTTVRQPGSDKGRIAGELLLDAPEESVRRRVVLPTELIVRSTTGPAPH
jgi:DNA-binding LacI/PurR family transcriptional regulator